jgi:Lon protease-like protein
MQQSTEPAPASPSFAGLLAALAAPGQSSWSSGDKPPAHGSAPAWNDDELAEDVATLSYERALRAHARYRTTDQSLTEPPELTDDLPEFDFAENSSEARTAAPASPFAASVKTDAAALPDLSTAPLIRNLKQASVTIRMSREECAQLHQRAAEAGLTVSAYLRSCTFEAESLRAMVKETLAQLRTANPQEKSARTASSGCSRLRRMADWLTHLLTPWQNRQREARA